MITNVNKITIDECIPHAVGWFTFVPQDKMTDEQKNQLDYEQLLAENSKLNQEVVRLSSEIERNNFKHNNALADRDENARAARKLRKQHERRIRELEAQLAYQLALNNENLVCDDFRIAADNLDRATASVDAAKTRLKQLNIEAP